MVHGLSDIVYEHVCVYIYIVWYMVYKHKDPTHHDFWHPLSLWALEPACEILMFVWPFGSLKCLHPGLA